MMIFDRCLDNLQYYLMCTVFGKLFGSGKGFRSYLFPVFHDPKEEVSKSADLEIQILLKITQQMVCKASKELVVFRLKRLTQFEKCGFGYLFCFWIVIFCCMISVRILLQNGKSYRAIKKLLQKCDEKVYQMSNLGQRHILASFE